MGVHVQTFHDGHREAVTALQLSVFDYVKALKGMLASARPGAANDNQTTSQPLVRSDEDGYPVIPDPAILNSCNKQEAALLMGDYLKSHYSVFHACPLM